MTDGEVGKIIHDVRKKRGLSQQELANKVGVTWEMISRYERGKSSALLKILEIANALEVSPSLFFSDSHSKLADTTRTYLIERFIPVLLRKLPLTKDLLQQAVHGEDFGIKVLTAEEHNSLFAIDLDAVEVHSDVPEIRNTGLLVCSFDTMKATSQSMVLTTRGEMPIISKYYQGIPVLARVMQWIVKF